MTLEEAQSIIDLLGQPEKLPANERELLYAQRVVDMHPHMMEIYADEQFQERRQVMLARYRRCLTMIAADILSNA